MSAIWQGCQGTDFIGPLQITVIRLAESQEQIATTVLVDTLDEQRILEHLLDGTKPPIPHGAGRYDYLIWTPFRYPPLPYGSRFGHRMHHGIFYASLTLDTALAECAYYRFVFLSGMSEPLPIDRLTTEHSSFEVRIDTDRGVALDAKPFDQYRAQISNPSNYEASQQLGNAMREAGIAAFTYQSARDKQAGINLGAFTLNAIKSRKPARMHQWICTTTPDKVAFIGVHAKDQQPFSFSLEQFLVSKKLPKPAC